MIEGAVPAGSRTPYLILVCSCPATVDKGRHNKGCVTQLFLPYVAFDFWYCGLPARGAADDGAAGFATLLKAGFKGDAGVDAGAVWGGTVEGAAGVVTIGFIGWMI